MRKPGGDAEAVETKMPWYVPPRRLARLARLGRPIPDRPRRPSPAGSAFFRQPGRPQTLPLRSGCRLGQPQREHAALARCAAFQYEITAVQAGQLPADRESQPEAGGARVVPVVRAVETLEDAVLAVQPDAETPISHHDDDVLASPNRHV